MELQSSKSAADCSKWLARVHEVQTSRMTPERKQELQMKVERARLAEGARRKMKACKSHAHRSEALMKEGLRQMACASAPSEYGAAQGRWMAAQKASAQRQEVSLSKMVALENSAKNAEACDAVVLRDESEDEEEAAGLAEAAALVGISEPAALQRDVSGGGAGAASAQDEFEKLLEQLKAEPSNDEEMGAKFMLYETYSEEVTKMRKTLFDFFEENKAAVPDAVQKGMEKELKSIDREESMGIPEHIRVWFVYHMMKQAGVNNTAMGGIMERFEKKLEFLANNDQDECPICLEKFSAALQATTLGCCHKVCGECWAHWCAVTHGHPFCPLCKNDEFVEVLHRRAGGGAGYPMDED